MGRPRLDPYCGLLLLLTGFALAPLLAPGFIGSHDGLLAVYRQLEMHRALSDGPFPPRWAPDFFFGYGYPFFNFYAPLAYYLGEVPHLLGASLPDAVELTFAGGFVLSGFAMYLLARDFLSQPGALLAAVAYVYFPYHLVDAHFRGDLSEFLAMSWFPALLWAMGRAGRGQPAAVPLAALLYAALILTHNVMALVFSPIMLAYGLWAAWWPAARDIVARPPHLGLHSSLRSLRGSLLLAAAVLLGCGLAAFFWVPALGEKDTVQIEHTLDDPSVDYHNHFAADLLSRDPVQRYATRADGGYRYAVQAGLVQVALAGLGGMAGLWLVWRRRTSAAPLIFFLLAGGFFWFLMSPASVRLWETLPLMPFVQFPWRFLALFGLPTAALAGYLGELGGRRGGKPLSYLAAAIAIAAAVLGLNPRYMLLEQEDLSLRGLVRFEVLTQAIGTTSIGEYLPRGVAQRPLVTPVALDLLREGQLSKVDARGLGEGAGVEVQAQCASSLEATVRSAGGRLVVRVPYWPLWKAYLDGQPAPIVPTGPQGLLGLDVPPGEHRLRVQLEDTPLRADAQTLSLVALAITVLWGIWVGAFWWAKRRKGEEAKRNGASSFRLFPSSPFRLTSGSARATVPFVLAAGALLGFTWLGVRPADLEANPAGAQYPLQVELGGRVEILGYDLRTAEDGAVELSLYWRALQPLETDYHAFLHLANPAGQIWGQGDRQAGPPGSPASTWRPGEVVVDRYRIVPRPGAPPGVYQVGLGLYDRATMQRLPITGEHLTRALFPDTVVRVGPLVLARPAPLAGPAAHPSRMRFEEYVSFLGYAVEGEEGDRSPVAAPPAGPPLVVKPGQEINLTLYWQARQDMDRDFSVFVHLLDEANRVVAQQDNQPALGAYPTSAWRKGEVLADQYSLRAPPTPGTYWIELGLYDALGKQRVGVDDGWGKFVGDRILLREVRVRA